MLGIRLRFPLLVLVIILIAATSRTVLGKNEEAKGDGDKEDGIVKSVSSALGRKMVSAQHLDKDETGLPELYSEKIMDSTTKATRKIGVFKSDETMLRKAIELDPFKKNNGKQHLDAVTEMFNMLNKDYQAKAHRRPPINNSSPPKDDADHVKH